MSRRQSWAGWGAGIATALMLVLGGAGAQAQDADPSAVIRIGSLYEPQNLDNTAGAGQGITEAFNGNVYEGLFQLMEDRKSTRLNSSHVKISYAVFCLKKKNTTMHIKMIA